MIFPPVDTSSVSISIHALLAESDACHNGQPPGIYHFYPRSPCGERRAIHNAKINKFNISIHALLAESDTSQGDLLQCPGTNFYPRSPCGERPNVGRQTVAGLVFLSTLSLRRATVPFFQESSDTSISIHALLAESDTIGPQVIADRVGISIHALLAESDRSCLLYTSPSPRD